MLAGNFIAGAVTKASGYGGHHDVFRAHRAWLYATILTVGYMISRGLAKSGSRGSLHRRGLRVRFALSGLVLAAVVFIVSGGHVLSCRCSFCSPSAVCGHRRRHRRWWKHEQHVGAKHGQDRPAAIFDLTLQ